VQYYGMPIYFNFSVAGGNGIYAWTDLQAYTVIGSVSYTNGIIASANASSTESLDNAAQFPAGSMASFFDAPGQPTKDRIGTVNGAVLSFAFSLQASVSSGGQSVPCPVVAWSAGLNWSTNKKRRTVQGSDSVQTQPTP
jgi:hypothetical protein